DIVVYNNTAPKPAVLKKYAREGDTLTSWKDLPKARESFGANLMSKRAHVTNKIGTPAKESSLVRHDSAKLASILMRVVETKKNRR
ncbi:MAG TPA: hypothetical protein VG102_03725, partial [Candidatus Paceibacterota bacterium]|nr:hypothetical protein [Candidatus Paceibacterota bacterium]